MSIISFCNMSTEETGQTLMTAAFATCLGIEHNYRILLLTSDFNDKTLERAFWYGFSKSTMSNILTRTTSIDTASGIEGLLREFASNHASGQVISSYAKPVLKDHLDVITTAKTKDIKEYNNISHLFSQIADVGNSFYDIVIVDISRTLSDEMKQKIMDLSTLVLVGLNQKFGSVYDFDQLRIDNEYFRKKNIYTYMNRYAPDSKFTQKNVARFLRYKDLPFTLPYNILFNDSCSEGKIVDYILSARTLTNIESPDFIFYKTLKETTDRIDETRRMIELRRI